MIRVLLSFRLETDLEVGAMPQPLLDRGPSISFTRRGAVPTRREFADYDVDLSFD
ncbi:hypothetical protein GW17_00047168, partial [Ensete ventricosum]